MCPHLEPDTIAYRDRAIHRGQLATYWTPSLMSQFNLAGGVGGCSTSLHYGRMVTFGFCSKSPFMSWEKLPGGFYPKIANLFDYCMDSLSGEEGFVNPVGNKLD